jgi:hypothetical protein
MPPSDASKRSAPASIAASIGSAIQHRQHDFAAVFFLEFDSDARIRFDEGGDVERQELSHGRGVGPQAHDADEARCVVGQVGGELIDVTQDALCMSLQRLSRDSQGDPAGMALQQYRTDGRLEIRHALACGADGQQRQLGALADAAAACNEAEERERDKVEAVEVHGAATPKDIASFCIAASKAVEAEGAALCVTVGSSPAP